MTSEMIARTNSTIADDLWWNILPYVLDCSQYSNISLVSKYINKIALQCIHDQDLALKFATSHPRKFQQLLPHFSKNSEFTCTTLTKTALYWNQVTNPDIHTIQCLVASWLLHRSGITLELPLAISSMDEVIDTKERTNRIINRNIQAPDWNAMSQVEASKIKVSSIMRDLLPLGLGSNNKWLILWAMKKEPDAFKYASPELQNNKAIALQAIHCGLSLLWVSRKLQNDPQIVLAAIKKDGTELGYASRELKNNKQIVREAVKQDSAALAYAGDEIHKDVNFLRDLIYQHPQARYHMYLEMKKALLLDHVILTVREVASSIWKPFSFFES